MTKSQDELDREAAVEISGFDPAVDKENYDTRDSQAEYYAFLAGLAHERKCKNEEYLHYYLHSDDNYYWTPQAWEEFKDLKIERKRSEEHSYLFEESIRHSFREREDGFIAERKRLEAEIADLKQQCTHMRLACEAEGYPKLAKDALDQLEAEKARHAELVEALEKIAKVKYGLDVHDTDEYLLEHWSRQALNYENIAREALSKLKGDRRERE